jgi:hypothetical protein
MADVESFYAENPTRKPELLPDTSDCRNWISDCTCPFCKEKKIAKTKRVASSFEDYNTVSLEWSESLSTHQYLLCPNDIRAFVFRTRTWGE